MAVFVSPCVKAELDDIWHHIATNSVSIDIANRVVESITDQFVQLSKHPHLGRRRDDLRPGLRSVVVGSYIVIYRVQGNNVRILHVVHGHRDIETVVRH